MVLVQDTLHCLNVLYVRNEFNFWNVHGIMYTSGLLQSEAPSLHVNFARDSKYS